MGPHQATFAAVGDIFLGDQPVCLGFGVRSLAAGAGYDSLFDAIREALAGYELVVGNLETVLASRDAVLSEKAAGWIDRAEPEAAAALSAAGITLVGLANNHIFEYGANGLNETTRHLQKNGIDWTGRKNHHIRNIAGHRVAFLSWSLLPDNYWPELDPSQHYNIARNVNAILDEVRLVRSGSDYVVLMLHWGNELVDGPSRTQQEMGHALIDGGVDVILGHHPHVLQPVERYKHGVIAYSLGNFVMDTWLPETRRSVILEVSLGKRIEYRAIPVQIDGRYRPELVVDEKQGVKTLSALEWREPLDDPVYRRTLPDLRRRYRLSSMLHFARNVHRVGIGNMLWIAGWGLRRIAFLRSVAGQEKSDPDIVYRGPMH